MESYNLGIIKMTTGKVGKGLILKRELSLDECKYILSEIFRFESYTLEDFYDEEEYQKQMDEYKDTVNAWLKGDRDDQYILDSYMSYLENSLGIMNMVLIIDYLKKLSVI
jgi:hypothetical protein